MSIKRNIVQYLFIITSLALLPTGCEKAKPVVASFTTDMDEVFAGDPIQFINNSENAKFYQWDFGDGNSSILENPTHVYDQAGTYKVSLVSIGGEESNTATRDINVILGFDVTIFEGVGIEGAFLGDSWTDIQSTFNSDTILLFRDTLENIEAYVHMAYYIDEGTAFLFINEDTLLNNDDPLVFVYLVAPYVGGTTKGVGIGSTMERVIAAYGEPEDGAASANSKAYWYDSKGVDFISFDNELVDEIDIYGLPSNKSASLQKSTIKNLLRNREKILPYRFPAN